MDQDRTASVLTRFATEGSRSSTVGLWYLSVELAEEFDEDSARAIRRKE